MVKVFKTFPRIFQGFALCETPCGEHKDLVTENIFRRSRPHRPKPMNQETADGTGGARPSGRNAMAMWKTDNSMRGTISIQVTGTTAGTSQATESTFPCANTVTAQWWSGFVGVLVDQLRAARGTPPSRRASKTMPTKPQAARARPAKPKEMACPVLQNVCNLANGVPPASPFLRIGSQ